MKCSNKLISMVLVLAMALGMMPAALAVEGHSDNGETTVVQYVEALNRQDWDGIISMSPNEEYQENQKFYYSQENADESVGFHAVTAATLVAMVELNSNELYTYMNADYYFDKYGELKLYLVGIDLSLDKESKYFYDGINFFLVVLGQEDSIWKVVLFSQAPALFIKEHIVTTQTRANDSAYVSSSDVSKAIEIIDARYRGIILDGNHNIIDTNIATAEQIAEEKGLDPSTLEQLPSAVATDDHTRPSTISVYITSTGEIKDVDFYDYCKCVLPNEWYGSWKTESLRAGAQAVKFVGWYRVYNAKYPNKGYDVKDSTSDQVYKAGTEYSTCTSAINDVGGIGIENSDNEIFYPAYLAGESDNAGQYGGTMYQWGSQYLAKQGYTYDEILSYYYSYSDVSSGEITTFTY